MSCQKGNIARSRPQKHKNKSAFKNNLHDTSHKTKKINNLSVNDVCERCKEIIEWKIKYKKYKPLTQPKTCVKCGLKTVKNAYHVMCIECGQNFGLCTKCCQSKEIINATIPEKEKHLKIDKEMKILLKSLPERKRRTFLRYMNKKKSEINRKYEDKQKDLRDKLDALKLEVGDNDDLDEDDFFDENEDNHDSDLPSDSDE